MKLYQWSRDYFKTKLGEVRKTSLISWGLPEDILRSSLHSISPCLHRFGCPSYYNFFKRAYTSPCLLCSLERHKRVAKQFGLVLRHPERSTSREHVCFLPDPTQSGQWITWSERGICAPKWTQKCQVSPRLQVELIALKKALGFWKFTFNEKTIARHVSEFLSRCWLLTRSINYN